MLLQKRQQKNGFLYPSALWPSPEQRCVSACIAGGWQATHTVCPSRRYCIHRAYGRFSRAQWCERDSVLNSTQYLLRRKSTELVMIDKAQARYTFSMCLHIIWVVLVKCRLDIIIANKSVSDPKLINGFLKTYTNYFSFHAPVQCFMYSLTFWLCSAFLCRKTDLSNPYFFSYAAKSENGKDALRIVMALFFWGK